MDIYTIIFLALAVFVFLRLRSVIGQRTGSKRPFRVSASTYRLSLIAAVLGAVNYVAYEANWYAAIAARVTPITTVSGPARVIDGDTVVVAGILLAMPLLLGAALFLSFLHWKEWRAQYPERGSGRVYLKKAKPLDGFLREDGAADAQSAREFRTVFNMTSQARKEAMIKNWMRRKGCSHSEAMRLAVEEWRGDRQREKARKREQEEQLRCNWSRGKLSLAQAFEILGLKEGATEQQVRAAYYRLMKRAHPDVSGSDYFAKQLNGARDLLVG